MKHGYFFEAHSIQPYIFEGGRLSDMVGASNLIENLLKKPLDDALTAVGIDHTLCNFTRRAGAAFTLLLDDKDKLEALRNLWIFVVDQKAPGLPFSHVVVSKDNTVDLLLAGPKVLNAQRNLPSAALPVAGPLVERAPRTGSPAVSVDDNPNKEPDRYVDAATRQKRTRKDEDKLFEKFREGDKETEYWFPKNMDPNETMSPDRDTFPFASDNRYIAVVHLDGNRIGQIIIDLVHRLQAKDTHVGADLIGKFSDSLKLATEAAARHAVKALLVRYTKKYPPTSQGPCLLPFRPLVLGGDDLTTLIRGEFALDFVTDFTVAFEQQTQERLAALTKSEKLPDQTLPDVMTACAGVAFVKANQPFTLAYRLADSLCAYAKKASRLYVEQQSDGTPVDAATIPSLMAFHRVTTSHITDYDVARTLEMSALEESADGKSTRLYKTLGAYAIDQERQMSPDIHDLLELKALFQKPDMSRGPLRHFLTLTNANMAEARQSYRRWYENMLRREDLKPRLDEYNALAGNLLGVSVTSDTLPFVEDGVEAIKKTFIGDIYHLLAVEDEAHDRAPNA